jgi:3-oxoacyl-[acyl-carrier protein] reductase
MLTPTLSSLFFIATTLVVVAYAPRGADAVEPKICGTPYGALRARSCDDRDDGWTRLAKEYVRWEDCATKTCPSLENGNVTKVLEFLTTGDHCEQNSLNTPNEISTLDQYSSTLAECNRVNGCGAACPCSVDEPCRCSDTQKKLDELIDLAEGKCPYASRPIPSLASVLALPLLNSVAGKNVLVIGGGRGNGRAIAAEFSRRGAKVYATSRWPQAYVDRGINMSRLFNGALIELDTTIPASQSALVGRLFAVGINPTNPIDILVLNSGIGASTSAYGTGNTAAYMSSVFNVNVFGHVEVFTRLFFSGFLRASSASRVIVTASIASESSSGSTYSMSKHAWKPFVNSIKNEIAALNGGDFTKSPQWVLIEPTYQCTTLSFNTHPLGANYTQLNPPSAGGTSINTALADCSVLPGGAFNGTIGSGPLQTPCRGSELLTRFLTSSFCCAASGPLTHPLYYPSLAAFGIPGPNPFWGGLGPYTPGQSIPGPCVTSNQVGEAALAVALLPNPEDRYFLEGATAYVNLIDEQKLVKDAHQVAWNTINSGGPNNTPLYYLFGIPCAVPCTNVHTPTLPEIDNSNLKTWNGVVRCFGSACSPITGNAVVPNPAPLQL